MWQNVAAAATAISYIVFVAHYVRMVRRRKVTSTLSTWVLFWMGSVISLATFLGSGGKWQDSFLNVLDPVATAIVVAAIVLWGPQKGFRFRPMERKHLVASVVILAFWQMSGQAVAANVLIQIPMALAYLPMYEHLVRTKQVSESPVSWKLSLLTSAWALCSAVLADDGMAILYASRSFLLAAILLALMARYALPGLRMVAKVLPFPTPPASRGRSCVGDG